MMMFGVQWASPTYAWLVWVIISLLVATRIYKYWLMGRVVQQSGLTFDNHRLLRFFSPSRQYAKLIFWIIGLFCIGLAFMHPRWGRKDEMVGQEGRDLFIVLDISRSMLAQDMQPDRLTRAKQKIKVLVNQLESERVGLVLFAGKPIVHCPLTKDIAAFDLFLDMIDRDSIASGTTNIDSAVNCVLDQYERLPSNKHKLAIICTDGEDFSSDLAGVRRRAEENGLHLFAMGYGSEHGSPIAQYVNGKQDGFLYDDQGAIVMSRLNEPLLKSLTTQLGGMYVSPTDDESDVREILRHVERFEKSKQGNRRMNALQEQYVWFVAISFFCFVIEWLL